MVGGCSFHVSEGGWIALVCELRMMEVRLDRLELMKEGRQFKTYSLRGNRKAKGSLFVNAYFIFCTLIALFEEIGD